MISRRTDMLVVRVTEAMKLEPNKIFVLPENVFITVQESMLVVRDREPSEIVNPAVDLFFTSLAADFGPRAAGIVLSGAGSDGLQGVKAIEKNGGLVMAQKPEDSLFGGMPGSVVEQDDPHIIDRRSCLRRDY